VQQHTYPPPFPRSLVHPRDLTSIPNPIFCDETLFALGNGYIGLRGTGEEGYSGPAGTSLDGTYLNGFYESEPIQYPEAAYGWPRPTSSC
jgi:alpha,alpha-trehalose phosphorylase